MEVESNIKSNPYHQFSVTVVEGKLIGSLACLLSPCGSINRLRGEIYTGVRRERNGDL